MDSAKPSAIRRYLTLAGLVLVVAVLAVWRFGFQLVDPRLLLWPPPAEVPPPAALDELVEIDANELPLGDLLLLLAQRHQLAIETDTQHVLAPVSNGDLVTRRLSGISLKTALRLILRDFGLTFGVQHGRIVVTTPQEWESNPSHYVGRVHTLERLLAARPEIDEEQLGKFVQTTIASKTWKGKGGCGELRIIPGALIVCQLPEVQDQIAALLAGLAEAGANRDKPTPRDLTPGTARLRAILREPTNLDATNRPLGEVLDELARRHRVSIVLDPSENKAIDDDIDLSSSITQKAGEVPLLEALNRILYSRLSRANLAILVHNDAIEITSNEAVNLSPIIRLYPIGDLLDTRRGVDAGCLIRGIEATTGADSITYSGCGKVDSFAGCLVVTDTFDNHELIESFLAGARRALQPEAGDTTELSETAGNAESGDREIVRCWYRLGDLLDGWPMNARLRPDQLAALVSETAQGVGWGDRQGGGQGRLTVVGDVLMAANSRAAQRDISQLLAALKRFKASRFPLATQLVGDAAPDRHAALEIALSQPAEIEVKDMPLGDFVETLSTRHGIPFRLDTEPLSRAGIYPTTKVTASFSRIPLRLALEILASQAGLQIEIYDEAVWLKPYSWRANTRFYDLRDILPANSAEDDPTNFLFTFIDARYGAGAAMEIARATGALVMPQPREEHAETERLLAFLRRSKLAADPQSPVYITATGSEAAARMEAILTRRVSFEFDNVPLDTALRGLAREHDFPLAIHTRDSAIAREVPARTPSISTHVADLPLGEAIMSLLSGTPYVYFVRDGVLVVTPGENGMWHHELRLYPVQDLLRRTNPQLASRRPGEAAFDEWVARQVGSMYWRWGRDGDDRPPPHPLLSMLGHCFRSKDDERKDTIYDIALWRGWLGVSARREDHRAIEQTLAEIAVILHCEPEHDAQLPAYANVGVYDLRPLLARFPELDERQMVAWLVRAVGRPLSSNHPQSDMAQPLEPNPLCDLPLVTLPGLLVVRQTPDEHAAICRCLAFLAKGATDFPRPYELAQDDNSAAAQRLARLVSTETDPLRLGYALWLVSFARPASAELAAAVVKRLPQPQETMDRRALLQVLRATADCGPAATAAIPLLLARLEPKPDLELESLIFETLSTLGPRGRIEFFRKFAQANSGPTDYPRLKSNQELISRFGRADNLLPVLLDLGRDQGYDKGGVLQVVRLIDPDFAVSREILKARQVDLDSDVRRRATELMDSIELQRQRHDK